MGGGACRGTAACQDAPAVRGAPNCQGVATGALPVTLRLLRRRRARYAVTRLHGNGRAHIQQRLAYHFIRRYPGPFARRKMIGVFKQLVEQACLVDGCAERNLGVRDKKLCPCREDTIPERPGSLVVLIGGGNFSAAKA